MAELYAKRKFKSEADSYVYEVTHKGRYLFDLKDNFLGCDLRILNVVGSSKTFKEELEDIGVKFEGFKMNIIGSPTWDEWCEIKGISRNCTKDELLYACNQ